MKFLKKVNRFFLFSVLFTFCFWTAAAQNNSAFGSIRENPLKSQQVKFTSYRLANGLRILLAPDEAESSIAINLSFDAGSNRETSEQAGLANLLQNTILQSLHQEAKSKFGHIDDNVSKLFNGIVNQERTSYFSEINASQSDFLLSAFARLMRAPDISQTNIDEQQIAVQNECKKSDETRFGRVLQALLELTYQDYAFKYGATCLTSKPNRFSPDKARTFLKTHYVPNNAVLVIVGKFKMDDAKKLIAKHFGAIRRQSVHFNSNFDKQYLNTERRRKILSNSSAKATTYMSAYLTVPSNHPDWFALNILADIIGQGDASRLYTALVAKKFASSVPEGINETRGQSILRIGAALLPEISVEKVEAIIDAEIARIQSDGVTKAEIEQARLQERQYSAEQLSTPLGKASLFARSTLYYNDPNRVNTELKRILAVTAEDVRRVARKYLVKTNRAVVIAQPANP